MAIPKKVLKALQERDLHCAHCGRTEDLVPHHRKNRGMGGSKLLDTLDNLMMVCPIYNNMMESDPKTAQLARGWKHKLPVWDDTAQPVFDVAGGWWYLDPEGGKHRVETRERF